jgi:hypothetical protein
LFYCSPLPDHKNGRLCVIAGRKFKKGGKMEEFLTLLTLGEWDYGDYNHLHLTLYKGSNGIFYVDYVDNGLDDDSVSGIDEKGVHRNLRELPPHIRPLWK